MQFANQHIHLHQRSGGDLDSTTWTLLGWFYLPGWIIGTARQRERKGSKHIRCHIHIVRLQWVRSSGIGLYTARFPAPRFLCALGNDTPSNALVPSLSYLSPPGQKATRAVVSWGHRGTNAWLGTRSSTQASSHEPGGEYRLAEPCPALRRRQTGHAKSPG